MLSPNRAIHVDEMYTKMCDAPAVLLFLIFFFFIASNLRIEIIILITFLGQFACGLDLNTNMELVGLREPYKATYKVTKTPRKTQHKQTSLKFDQTAVDLKLPFLFSSIL